MIANGNETRRCGPNRGIRLAALQANPEAFGKTYAVENAQPLSWFSDRLARSAGLGAFCDAGAGNSGANVAGANFPRARSKP